MSYWKIVLIGALFIAFILIGFVVITKNFENKEQIDNSENAGRHIPVIVENENLKKKTKIIKTFDNIEIKQGETKCTDIIDVEGYNKIMLFHRGPPKEQFPFCPDIAEACCHLPIQIYGNFILENNVFKYAPGLPILAGVGCNTNSATKEFDITFPKIQFCMYYRKKDTDDNTELPLTVKNTVSYIFLTQ